MFSLVFSHRSEILWQLVTKSQDNLKCALLIACACVLTACDSDNQAFSTAHIDNGELRLEIPERIRNINAVDLNAVRAIANVNGQNYELTRIGNQFQRQIEVNQNTNVNVSLLFRELLPSGEELDLARHSSITRRIETSNETVRFLDDNFDIRFDDDGDGVFNLAERECGTDPKVFASPRQLDLSFEVPAIINDPVITQAIVTFAGTPRGISRTANSMSASGTVPFCPDARIEVVLIQRYQGTRVDIAKAVKNLRAGSDDRTIQLFDGDFDFAEDRDGDGRTNLQEMQNGTNPLVRD